MGFTTTRADDYSTDKQNRRRVSFTSKVIDRLGEMVSKRSVYIPNTLHLYIACVHYIRTHPHRACVEREGETQAKMRHLDVVVAVVVVVVAGGSALAGGGGGGVAAATIIAIADVVVENRKKR